MTSLKRSASLYTSRSSSKPPHQPVIKKSNLNETTNISNNEDNPSRFLRNKFKSCQDDDALLKSNKKRQSLNLSISDCTCPICLEVLIEPVRMPCTHELCLPCFKAMTDQTNFLCPMCRMRISSWSRYASNTNTLVNMERWEQIQRAFPTEIKNRIEGKTADILAESLKTMQQQHKQENVPSNENTNPSNSSSGATNSKMANCKTGEIRKEYQDYLKREEERLKIEKETEEKLSLELIQQLIREEENLSLDDYLNAINSNQDMPSTSTTQPTSVNTRLFASLNNKLIKNSKLNETKLLSRPVLAAQSSRTILNNQNKHHTPVINYEPRQLLKKVSTNTPTTITTASSSSSSTSENDVPIALSIKLHPRNSIKKSREEVKSIVEKLRQNSRHINYSQNDDSILDDNSTLKRRLRSTHHNHHHHQNNDTTLDNNNRSYSSNDESVNSSIISTMSTMSLRSRRN